MRNKWDFHRSWFLGVLGAAILLVAGDSATGQTTPNKDKGLQNSPAVIEILEKYTEAIGGRELMRSIKTSETRTETEFLGNVNKSYRLRDLETGRSYELKETSKGRTEEGFDGKRVWRKSPEFRGYLAENDPQVKALTSASEPIYEYEKHKHIYERLPNESVDGKDYFVLARSTTDSLGRNLNNKYYFDKNTYLLWRRVAGGEITQTTIYDDYRKVDGRMVAFATTIVNQQVTVKVRIVSIKYNPPVDASKFAFQDDTKMPVGSEGMQGPVSRGASAAVKSDESAILPEDLRLETFEVVWNKVNDTYWDRTFGGVNWKAVHDKYLPLVKATSQSDAYHQLLNKMLGELGRSHFAVASPSHTLGLHSSKAELKRSTTGLSLRWVDAQLVVYDVGEDSSSWAAGLRKGFVITKITGKTVEDIYADYRRDKTGFQYREEYARVTSAMAELGKTKAGTPVKVEALNGKDTPITLEIIPRETVLISSLRFQHKHVTPDIGYIKFNLFLGDLQQKFKDALAEFRDTKAIIIDLRGNPGGAGDLAPALANLLSETPGSVGTFVYRYERQNITYEGTKKQAYTGRIVLLIDAHTASTAEVFAGALQEQKRAIVVGSTSLGAVLPSLQTELPNGGGLIYVVSNYLTPKGIALEGRGVIPDIAATPLRADLLAGRDTALERALKVIQNSN